VQGYILSEYLSAVKLLMLILVPVGSASVGENKGDIIFISILTEDPGSPIGERGDEC
jgi:hypothetical protein